MPKTIRKLCPKNHNRFIADCKHGQHCLNCEQPNAPIAKDDTPNHIKDALHELLKIYSNTP